MSVLHDRAMLVRLKIKVPTFTMIDRTTTDEVLKDKQAKTKSAGRFNKSLLPNNEHLKEIKRIAGFARNFNYQQTLPWTDQGARILPTRRYNTHTKELTTFRHKFDHAVDQFIAAYKKAITDAQKELGNLFDPDDYPSENRLREEFNFDLNYDPIPHSDDFRITLHSKDLKRIRTQLEKKAELATDETRRHLYERLYRLVEHLGTTLQDADAKFKNSITGNIEDLTAIMDDMNITNDPELKKLSDQAAQIASGTSPDDLRKDSKVRSDTAEKSKKLADAIAERMKEFTR